MFINSSNILFCVSHRVRNWYEDVHLKFNGNDPKSPGHGEEDGPSNRNGPPQDLNQSNPLGSP